MAKKQVERRSHKRIPLQVLVSYEHEGKTIDNFSFNLSEGGIYIETLTPYQINKQIELTFEDPRRKIHFKLIAEVVRINTKVKPFGMGLKFIEVSKLNKTLLESLLNYLDKVS